MVVLHAYYRLIFPPPLPYQYTLIGKAPESPVLCPGAELIYTRRVEITRAPVTINLYRTIYSLDYDQTFIFGGAPIVAIHDTEHTITRTFGMVVPNLPKGSYQLRESAQDFSTRSAVISVPFTVPAGCRDRPDLPPQLERPNIRVRDLPFGFPNTP
jgi:hypothetical protein